MMCYNDLSASNKIQLIAVQEIASLFLFPAQKKRAMQIPAQLINSRSISNTCYIVASIVCISNRNRDLAASGIIGCLINQ